MRHRSGDHTPSGHLHTPDGYSHQPRGTLTSLRAIHCARTHPQIQRHNLTQTSGHVHNPGVTHTASCPHAQTLEHSHYTTSIALFTPAQDAFTPLLTTYTKHPGHLTPPRVFLPFQGCPHTRATHTVRIGHAAASSLSPRPPAMVPSLAAGRGGVARRRLSPRT